MNNANGAESFSDPLQGHINRRLLSNDRPRPRNSVISELKILLDGVRSNSHTMARLFITDKIHQVKEMAPDQSHCGEGMSFPVFMTSSKTINNSASAPNLADLLGKPSIVPGPRQRARRRSLGQNQRRFLCIPHPRDLSC